MFTKQNRVNQQSTDTNQLNEQTETLTVFFSLFFIRFYRFICMRKNTM